MVRSMQTAVPPPTVSGSRRLRAGLMAWCAVGAVALSLFGCASRPGAPASPQQDGPPLSVPPNLADLPDVVPQVEPIRQGGPNKPYVVLGQTYEPLQGDVEWNEQGGASWYGNKFHGRRTASGELYSMFGLTAAHKTLPLPTFARVTNLRNGQSIVVRINDRGPFHSSRIIDLSYAAAAKLGMLGNPGMVEIEALTPGENLPPPGKLELPRPTPSQSGYLQVAAYSDPINAVSLKGEITRLGITNIEIRTGTFNGDPIHRVLVGPFADNAALVDVRNRLLGAGLAAEAVGR